MFKRKPRNRRRKREEHILDVKVQSDYVTRERIERVIVFVSGALIVGLLGFGLYWLTKFTAGKFFFDNPNFTIAHVQIESDGHLTREQILRRTNIRAGQSVFEVDLQQVKRDLEIDPLIERAEVTREMPSRICIAVTERVAIAQVCVIPFGRDKHAKPVVFYVDRYGYVMRPHPLKSQKPLPALTGISLADLRVGRPIRSPQVYAAIELLNSLELSQVGVRLEPDRIDLSRADSLTLTTRTGETIAFDPQRIPQCLRRLGIIMADVERSGVALNTVDLTVQQNVPVTVRALDSGPAKNL